MSDAVMSSMEVCTMDRVVLGTVQIGLPYGRRREADLISRDDAFALLDSAWDAGIRAFDTAEAYGESPSRLASWLERRGAAVRSKAHIVTKVSPADPANLRVAALAALSRFPDVASLTVLTHGPASPLQWQIVAGVAEQVGAAPGQSVYDPDEVRAAVVAPGLVRLQAPANVFDERALRARGAAPVSLDVRSVFLQGLLLDEPSVAEARVAGGGEIAIAVRRAAAAADAAPAPLLLATMLEETRPTDRLVIGIDAAENLDAIVQAFDLSRAQIARFREGCRASQGVFGPRVLDPRQW